jgi:hypothetical protein
MIKVCFPDLKKEKERAKEIGDLLLKHFPNEKWEVHMDSYDEVDADDEVHIYSPDRFATRE